MTEKAREICENCGWTVRENNGSDVELSKYSPAGEDFSFTVGIDDDLADAIQNEYYDYDVDEHVMLWINNRGHNGVPGTIRELLEDAEAIEKMIEDLYTALREAEKAA